MELPNKHFDYLMDVPCYFYETMWKKIIKTLENEQKNTPQPKLQGNKER